MNHEPTEIVENYLREQLENNLRQKIWPSNNAVITRFLEDGANLRAVWDELLELCPLGHVAFNRTHDKWRVVLDTIIDVAAGWSPEKTKETRQALNDVIDLTAEIKDKALELAALLRRRTRICEANSIR